MRYYEILYIVNPNFERKKIDDTMNEIDIRLKETKSKIINHIIWGKKRLAYTMQGHKYGTYVLLHYESGDQKKLDEFDAWLKLSNLVVRHMIVRLDKEPDVLESVEGELPKGRKEVLETDKDKDKKK
jgi:small subunit ribosomal protein S6